MSDWRVGDEFLVITRGRGWIGPRPKKGWPKFGSWFRVAEVYEDCILCEDRLGNFYKSRGDNGYHVRSSGPDSGMQFRVKYYVDGDERIPLGPLSVGEVANLFDLFNEHPEIKPGWILFATEYTPTADEQVILSVMALASLSASQGKKFHIWLDPETGGQIFSFEHTEVVFPPDSDLASRAIGAVWAVAGESILR